MADVRSLCELIWQMSASFIFVLLERSIKFPRSHWNFVHCQPALRSFSGFCNWSECLHSMFLRDLYCWSVLHCSLYSVLSIFRHQARAKVTCTSSEQLSAMLQQIGDARQDDQGRDTFDQRRSSVTQSLYLLHMPSGACWWRQPHTAHLVHQQSPALALT